MNADEIFREIIAIPIVPFYGTWEKIDHAMVFQITQPAWNIAISLYPEELKNHYKGGRYYCWEVENMIEAVLVTKNLLQVTGYSEDRTFNVISELENDGTLKEIDGILHVCFFTTNE